MPFPNVPEKYKGKSILTPQHLLAYHQKIGLLPKGDAPDGVILCLQRSLPERMSRRHPYKNVGRLIGDLYLLKKTRKKICVLTNFGLGSPQIAGLAEEFIAWGTKKIISISMTGALQPNLKPGDVVICNQAIRDEGTSHHYLPPAKYILADPQLVASLLNAVKSKGLFPWIGTSWTTDATFRETDLEVAQYQAEGVLTVEMESAALFAVAAFRNIQAASAFVVGDKLANADWQAPPDMEIIDRSFEAVYAASIEVLDNP